MVIILDFKKMCWQKLQMMIAEVQSRMRCRSTASFWDANAGSLICCHSCALKWSHLRTNFTMRGFPTQSSVEVCVCAGGGVCRRVRGSVCVCMEMRESEQVSEISPPKNLAIWSSTHPQRERERERRKTDRERAKKDLVRWRGRKWKRSVFFCQEKIQLETHLIPLPKIRWFTGIKQLQKKPHEILQSILFLRHIFAK